MRSICLMLFACLLLLPAHALELDESPAAPSNWGYRPADGHVVSINPPVFSWRPVSDASGYRVQVAADADFEDLAYEVVDTPWSGHVPDTTLAPGAWYWRYAAHDAQGESTDWSTVRRFEVPVEAVPFPQPPLAELQARIPAEHPRLFFRPEEIETFRELAEGRLAEHWANILRRAERLLEDPPDTTEPPLYGPDVEPRGAEWRRIWWGNRTHAIAVTDAAATLAFAYRISGDERFGHAARELVMAFAEWDPAGSTNYRYNDEAAMPLLYYPARAYTWAHDLFSDEERERLRAVMTQRGEDCFNHLRGGRHLWNPYRSHQNRAWHKLGEAAIAFQGEIPEADKWLDYITTIFFVAYPVWGVHDGGWHEGIAYWDSYLARFLNWVFISQSAFGIDPFDKPFFSETGYYGMYTMPPGTSLGSFADQGILRSSQRNAPLMARLAAGAQNPHWLWYADEHGVELDSTYFDFIFHARSGGLEAQAPEDLPSSKVFPDVGLAVLNSNLLDGTDNVQVHFKSSPFGRQSHGYNANNAFLLYVHGEPVFIRSGRRDIHGSPHHREWMWETKSDNAILVNGKGQVPHTASSVGEITHFHTSETLDVVVGEADGSYEGEVERWTRRILFFKPHAVLIHDILETPEPADFQWLLHAHAPAFELGENRAHWEGDAGRVDVEWLLPQGLELSQTDEFSTPPAEWATFTLDEWHLTAATTDKTERQEFLTLIRVHQAEVEARAEDIQGGITVDLRLPEDQQAAVTLLDGQFTVEHQGQHVKFGGDEATDADVTPNARDSAVVEAVVSHLLTQSDFSFAGQPADGTHVVLHDRTPDKTGFLKPQQMRVAFGDQTLCDELELDLKRRNEIPDSFDAVVASYAGLDFSEAVVVDAVIGSEGFEKKHSQARAWFEPYLPAYSEDGTRAVVYGFVGPWAHAATVAAILKQSEGAWVVESYFLAYYA